MTLKISITDAVLYECSIIGCPRVTVNPANPDPRLRWAVDMKLKDGEKTVALNLCPAHVRELLFVDDDFYERLTRTEKFVREPESGSIQ